MVMNHLLPLYPFLHFSSVAPQEKGFDSGLGYWQDQFDYIIL